MTITTTAIRRGATAFLYGLALYSAGAESAGDFALNFNHPTPLFTDPTEFNVLGSAGAQGFCAAGTTCSNNDGTAFSQQIVKINGVNYYHNVVGDPATGFSLDYYTRQSPGGTERIFIDGGGMERSKHEAQVSGCTGNSNNGTGLRNCTQGDTPFGVFTLTGNGANDPGKMVMRMVMDSGDGMSLEVYKPLLANKPKITQTLISGDLSSEFTVDMRGLSYSDKDTAAIVVQRQTIDDPLLPTPGSADFDMSLVDRSHVTAGRYSYTRGNGWGVDNGSGWQADAQSANLGWSLVNSAFDYGSYSYAEGSFDVLNIDWGGYFNYSDNAAACTFGTARKPSSCPGGP